MSSAAAGATNVDENGRAAAAKNYRNDLIKRLTLCPCDDNPIVAKSIKIEL